MHVCAWQLLAGQHGGTFFFPKRMAMHTWRVPLQGRSHTSCIHACTLGKSEAILLRVHLHSTAHRQLKYTRRRRPQTSKRGFKSPTAYTPFLNIIEDTGGKQSAPQCHRAWLNYASLAAPLHLGCVAAGVCSSVARAPT